MIGGLFAAPIAAWIITVIPQRALGLIVGFFIVFLNTRQLALAFDVSEAARWFASGVVVLVGLAVTAGIVGSLAASASRR
jgi:hypothetical protein